MKSNFLSQHKAYTEWLDKLVFYRDELRLMQKRLEELVLKKNNPEVKFKAEHFQNLIFIEEQTINKLSHHLLSEDKKLRYNVDQDVNSSLEVPAKDFVEDQHMIEFFEKNFATIKKEFNDFKAECL